MNAVIPYLSPAALRSCRSGGLLSYSVFGTGEALVVNLPETHKTRRADQALYEWPARPIRLAAPRFRAHLAIGPTSAWYPTV